MKVSYTELNRRYFNGKLPTPEVLAEALTFHAWEIEEVTVVGNDTVLDVKVLPDKSAWALSHRGIAKDISAILSLPLAEDVLGAPPPQLSPLAPNLSVSIETPTCTRYTAALMRGVTVGPSPEWLVDVLASLGQRSINNVVDITNYVMFSLGQPLHAFDASKLSRADGEWKITVRNAGEGESITTLTGESYTLTQNDALIVDGVSDTPIGIAGVKGGTSAEVDSATVDIILESAHFDAVAVRKTSQRLKLRTDASTRYENGVSRSLASYGVSEGATLILEHCGGTLVGYVDTEKEPVRRSTVSVTLSHINSVLGLTLTTDTVESLLSRFGFLYSRAGESFTLTPPHERPDLVIPEDIIEEIGRIYGYEHVASLPITPLPLREINKRFFYAEAIRDALVSCGFSEVFTSSFREHDEVKLRNALATDKGYLRSEKGMRENMKEALAKNAPLSDLFGSEQVRIFEIGTAFTMSGERYLLTLGVSSKQGFVAKKDQKALDAGVEALTSVVGEISGECTLGVCTFDIGAAIEGLPKPVAYTEHPLSREVAYVPFSPYPYLTRDVAFWTPKGTTAEVAEAVVRSSAGGNVARIDMFDTFAKDDRVSYGFRIVFQSHEKTLDGAEADAYMQTVYEALRTKGFEVR